MSIATLIRLAAGIAFPRACAGCLEPGELLCDGCADAARPAPERAFDGFDRCVSAFVHEGAPRAALLAAKLGGERRGLAQLAARIPLIDPTSSRHDVVTSVPDTYRTRAQRGGSVAGDLARRYAHRAGIPYAMLLRKRVATLDHGGATRAQRLADQRDAYAPARAAPARVLLVDDVVTTGATAAACAAALVSAGARELVLVTFTVAIMRSDVSDADRFDHIG